MYSKSNIFNKFLYICVTSVTVSIDISEGVFLEKVFDNGAHRIMMHRQSVGKVISTVYSDAYIDIM
ncbi:MAG: hypothetical protein QME25_05045 [Bacteroidota bacterium]|nr:hypothetical protein [Bacteroidota bacterium]